MNEIVEVMPAQVDAGPLAMALQALKGGMQVADIEKMLALQMTWEANEARKAYVSAMAEYKLTAPEIFKTKLVSFEAAGGTTSYKHATLGDVTTKIVDGLARHGISHAWDTTQDNGVYTVTCILTHRLGHFVKTSLSAGGDNSGKKNLIQQMGSTVTYLQRYTLLGACGLATKDEEDDDGRGTEPTLLAEWTERASMALTIDVLNETKKLGAVEFNAVHDGAGYKAFKTIVAMKALALKAAAPQAPQ